MTNKGQLESLEKGVTAGMNGSGNHNSSLTPEQIRLALRLESIFMPQATRQRIQAGFGDDTAEQPIRFVHYTSAEAALSVIKSKRMWMRNTTCMSDYREVQHGLDIIQQFFSDKTKTAWFVAALDACFPGLALETLEAFFDRLIIGPSSYPWVMYEAFVSALTKAGCLTVDNRVVTSNIPIRV
jgi:hypothetical protein